MILQIMGAFMAMFTFAVLLETPKKYLTLSGCIAAFSWFIYLICSNAGMDEVVSSFISALLVTLVAQLLSRKLKQPTTLFLVAGIIPTVPGTGMYKIAYYVILGNSQMYSYHLMETLKIAGAISLAIFLMDSMYRMYLRIRINRKQILNKASENKNE